MAAPLPRGLYTVLLAGLNTGPGAGYPFFFNSLQKRFNFNLNWGGKGIVLAKGVFFQFRNRRYSKGNWWEK